MDQRPEPREGSRLRDRRRRCAGSSGAKSYHDFALGIALLLIAAAIMEQRSSRGRLRI